jgi:tetratricopeptide (TPR) repeat protein
MVPMRKVWDRVGTIASGNETPKGGSFEELSQRRERFENNPLSREALKELYAATMLSGDVERASELAERWSEKDPMDPDALTARADVAAQRGDRDLAIRILGSVVDVRPHDHQAQFRLARLFRWAGAPERGCRHSFAAAQLRPSDEQLLARAVRCLRDGGKSSIASALLAAANEDARRDAERIMKTSKTDDAGLSGDLRLEAQWNGAATDIDLVIMHPDGYRVSWLGAPTRSVITATDVLSRDREGLALRGAKAGEYAIEVVRAERGSTGVVRGEVKIRAGTTDKTVPFTLERERTRIGTVKISMRSRLVPL